MWSANPTTGYAPPTPPRKGPSHGNRPRAFSPPPTPHPSTFAADDPADDVEDHTPRNLVVSRVNLFSVFAGKNVVIGVFAHFFLVLVVSIVTSLIGHDTAIHASVSTATLATVSAMAGAATSLPEDETWSHWHIVILVLLSALMMAGLSYLTQFSWPMVSEKAIFTALFWMLYGAVIGNFGICMCCDGGPWATFCGGTLYQQLFSVLWLVALVMSYLVEARLRVVRTLAMVIVMGISVLLLLAPLNACASLTSPGAVIAIKILVFHLIWHGNRIQRLSEASLYSIITRNVAALQEVHSRARTSAPVAQHAHLHSQRHGLSHSKARNDHVPRAVKTPEEAISQWGVLRSLASALNHDGITAAAPSAVVVVPNAPSAAVFHGTSSTHAARVTQHIPPVLSPEEIFVHGMEAARRAIPSLDDFHYAMKTDPSTSAMQHDPETPGDDEGNDEFTDRALDSSATRGTTTRNIPLVDWRYRHYSHQVMTVVDTIRAAWVLGVCWPYLIVAVAQLLWIYYMAYQRANEIVQTARRIHVEAIRLSSFEVNHPHQDTYAQHQRGQR